MSLQFTVEGYNEQECLELTLETVRTVVSQHVFRQSVACLWTCVSKRYFSQLRRPTHMRQKSAEYIKLVVSTDRT